MLLLPIPAHMQLAGGYSTTTFKLVDLALCDLLEILNYVTVEGLSLLYSIKLAQIAHQIATSLSNSYPEGGGRFTHWCQV